jgi:transcriptional regulator of acetoin/glycerol metabolism
VIEASLREAGGNISRAAQSLGLSRQALYRRMERFNLRPAGGA